LCTSCHMIEDHLDLTILAVHTYSVTESYKDSVVIEFRSAGKERDCVGTSNIQDPCHLGNLSKIPEIFRPVLPPPFLPQPRGKQVAA